MLLNIGTEISVFAIVHPRRGAIQSDGQFDQ
jgi:hypothetical protein